jgi:hypothetical protein
MILTSKDAQENNECHPDGLQFKTKDMIIQDLLDMVKKAEREWRADMGNPEPDINEFDALVVVRLLLSDSHFFNQSIRREYGETLLQQWDKNLLCQQTRSIKKIINGDQQNLYTFLRSLDAFVDSEPRHDNSTRFKF